MFHRKWGVTSYICSVRINLNFKPHKNQPPELHVPVSGIRASPLSRRVFIWHYHSRTIKYRWYPPSIDSSVNLSQVKNFVFLIIPLTLYWCGLFCCLFWTRVLLLCFYYLVLLTLKHLQWSNRKGLNKISNSKSYFYFVVEGWWAFVNKINLIQSWCRIFHPQSSKDFIKGASIIISILYMRILKYK